MTTWTCLAPGQWSSTDGRFNAVREGVLHPSSSIGCWHLTDEAVEDRYAIQHTLRACRRVVDRWIEVDAMRALAPTKLVRKKTKALDDSKGASQGT